MSASPNTSLCAALRRGRFTPCVTTRSGDAVRQGRDTGSSGARRSRRRGGVRHCWSVIGRRRLGDRAAIAGWSAIFERRSAGAYVRDTFPVSVSVFIDGAAGTTGHRNSPSACRDRDATSPIVTLPDDRRKDAAARRRSDQRRRSGRVVPSRRRGARGGGAGPTIARTRDRRRVHRPPGHARTGPTAFPNSVAGQAEADGRRARASSNPGCYPTGFLALVRAAGPWRAGAHGRLAADRQRRVRLFGRRQGE